jgi:hypothetical protein
MPAMRCLSYVECAEWCERHGYAVIERDHYGRPAPGIEEHFELFQLHYPLDSRDKVRLAHDVVEWSQSRTELLLWIGEWGVFPRSEHMPLFTRFRAAIGESRPLIEAPGCLVGPEDVNDAISVLSIALFFFWDCHVFSSGFGPVFHCSHDEWNGFFLPRGYDDGKVANAFSGWLPRDDNRHTKH